MSLDNFYQLREKFIIIGLTGKMQSGSHSIVDFLTQEKLTEEQLAFLEKFKETYSGISNSESRKIRRLIDFFNYPGNWVKFDHLDYKNVLLLFILFRSYDRDTDAYANEITNWILNLGTYKNFISPRFGNSDGIAAGSKEFLEGEMLSFLKESLPNLHIAFSGASLSKFLSDDEALSKSEQNFFFCDSFSEFARKFYDKLDEFSPYLRQKLINVTAYCLRRFGSIEIDDLKKNTSSEGLEHIYTIADVINKLIKIHRVNNGKKAQIVIDRLKNSYELVYFREKYSGFYMVTTSQNEEVRGAAIKEKIERKVEDKVEDNLKLMIKLDETEYKVNEFSEGKFEGFDIENCVQKADYHVVLRGLSSHNEILDKYEKAVKLIEKDDLDRTNEFYVYWPLELQLLKLLGLILQPGLIAPSYIERIMQLAYNAKLNSGCISRQVGAVVTDEHFSVKGIGWNDVPLGQIPCSMRDIRDLVNDRKDGFSQFELGETDHNYKDGKKFIEKIKEDFKLVEGNLDVNLKGRSCSFCFKSFHNSYEYKVNQVHTRSLHAEENAMLQISKYGGQALKGGNLFTTASPCELCSKKAYQLNIQNIFYIDEYPGIAKKHILEGGKKNPNMYQYQGAIGRGYFKLYEPFMALKDEITIRTNLKPTITEKEKVNQLRAILEEQIKNHSNPELIKALDNLKNEDNILERIVDLIEIGVKNKKQPE